jgi:hypothetical protein
LLDAVSEKLAKIPLMRRLAERMVREKPEVGGSQILDAVGRNPTLRNMLAQHVVEAAKDLGSGNVWEVQNHEWQKPGQLRSNSDPELGPKLIFEDAAFEKWFKEVFYPAMEEPDKSNILRLSNSCVNTYMIRFADLMEENPGAEKNDIGFTTYNFSSDRVEILIDKSFLTKKNTKGATDFNQIVPIIGDEFQHAVQFERGEIGFFQTKQVSIGVTAGATETLVFAYDIEDEIESQEGGLRVTENYIKNALLKTERQKNNFITKRESRIKGYGLISAGNDNWALNSVTRYLAKTKNPFPELNPDKVVVSPATYLTTIAGYESNYFIWGSFDPEIQTSPGQIVDREQFKIGELLPRTRDRILSEIVYTLPPCQKIKLKEQ